MRSTAELAIELNALFEPHPTQQPVACEAVEVEDIGALNAQLNGLSAAAATDQDSIEIELTAQEIDDLLSGQSIKV